VSEQNNNKPTVFISYSHKDEVWKDRLNDHLGVLEMEDHLQIWDDRAIDAGDEWYEQIKSAMANASVAICLVSAPFLRSSFVKKEEIPYLLERREESGMLIIPILLRPCVWKAVPWLKKLQMFPRDGLSIANDHSDDGDEVFAEVAHQIYELFNNPDYQAPKPAPPEWEAPQKIDIEHLPISGSELFGRDDELEWLDERWQCGTTRVTSLIAWGGVGKSTLVNRWLEGMAKDNYRGAGKVFGWSFYSQGTREQVTTADQFIQAALNWFGDEAPDKGSPWDKGQRLAALVLESNALLILDGMEPLQEDNAIECGKVKDPALETLLKALAMHKGEGGGLCLITSRVEVADLLDFPETCFSRPLEKLSAGAGRALLRVGGVKGSDAALEEATEDFGRHALALRLLVGYLSQQAGHHISEAKKLSLLETVPEKEGRHARRVIAAFEALLGEGSELALLRLLGLFDRPLERGPLEALLAAPAIPGLTEPLLALSVDGLLKPLGRLRQLGLIAAQSTHRPDTIDAHPLLREHFQAWLQQTQSKAWREGNARLFEYYRSSAKEFPDTLEEMTPLFWAMGHGCAAGLFQVALEEVYWARILRGNEFFCGKKLGAIGSELAALAGLFEHSWSRPVGDLAEVAQRFLLNQAGFNLRALGRLVEAVKPMEAGLDAAIKQEDWRNAAQGASNLSEFQLTLGNLPEAQSQAEQAMAFADLSKNAFRQMADRITLADALFQSGRFEKASILFQEAEQMQKETQPHYPLLYSLGGYRYCDLLLEQSDYAAVRERTKKSIQIAQNNNWLLDVALDHLSLGRAHLLQSQANGGNATSKDWDKAANHLNRAVEGLRESGTEHNLPWGLLARAMLYRVKTHFKKSQQDLDETFALAQRSGMPLFEADAHLEQTRLYLDQNKIAEAKGHLEQAKAIIEQTGYHRRDGAVKELEASLG